MLLPSDLDGDLVVDRIYVSDTCANLWRVDIVGATTSNWKVSRLATFGSADTGQPIRKFLFRPDVVTLDRDPSKLAILVGSGDREAPFDLAVSNAFYMVIDSVQTPHVLTVSSVTTPMRSLNKLSGMLIFASAISVEQSHGFESLL